MRRIYRPLLLALLAVVLGLAASQAQAAPFSMTPIARPFCNTEVYGFGETATEALNNAVAAAKADYVLFSYTVEESRCEECEILDPTPNDPFHTTTETICWVELKICGIKKFSWPLYSR